MERKINIAVFLELKDISALSMSRQQFDRLSGLRPDWHFTRCTTVEEFLAALPDAHAALTWTFRQEWFSLASALRCISTPAAGKDYFTVEWPAGVTSLNGTFHGRLMGESAVAMVLAMTRGLLPAVTTYRDNPWPRREIDAIARPPAGSTVTICGFGSIGRYAGKMFKSFGVTINGVSRSRHPAPEYFTAGDRCLTIDELEQVLPVTDHLLLVLPRSPETDNFLSAHRLELLPPHATVTNLGRGNAVDEAALVAALTRGRIAGACLDVTAVEPLPADSPLRSCPNLWITPHSSAFAPNYMDLYADEIIPRLEKVLQ